MEVIINRKKWDIWAFDLESHNDDESIKNGKTSMWLGCLLNDKSTVEDENSYLYTMDEFLDRIELLSRKVNKKSSTKKTGNMMIYIYNHLNGLLYSPNYLKEVLNLEMKENIIIQFQQNQFLVYGKVEYVLVKNTEK